jgi:hypothetical protein
VCLYICIWGKCKQLNNTKQIKSNENDKNICLCHSIDIYLQSKPINTNREMNTQHTHKQRIAMVIAISILMLLGCTSKSGQIVRAREQDEREKWERFLECSKNEGDAGCDSCYFLVYGKHIDPFKK